MVEQERENMNSNARGLRVVIC